jgi:cobalt-zinc-cadmium efflux system protein
MDRTRRLAVSLALTIGLVVVQVVVGLGARSTGLLADAGHNLTDLGALGLSLVAVRLALRPASPERSFGNHRATILAALGNAVLIAGVTVLIVVGAVHRLAHPEPTRAGIVAVVAAVGLLVNAVAAWVLTERSGDLNMRSAALHMVGDALASAAVVVGALVLLAAPSATWVDPASALVVAAIIVSQAAGVLRDSVAILLESTPADVDLDDLAGAVAAVEGVGGIHDLHVWSLSSEMRVLSAHLVLTGSPTLEEAQEVGNRVKRAICGPFGIAHTTLELECAPCADVHADPCAIEGPPAVEGAARPVGGHLHRH